MQSRFLSVFFFLLLTRSLLYAQSGQPAVSVKADLAAKTLHFSPILPPCDYSKSSLSEYLTMENYSVEQGLAVSAVLCSCRDRYGNLWFGTEGGGVSRYDGKSFTRFTTAQGLSNNIVNSILEDKRTGYLWMGTRKGVACYDGRSFKIYSTEDGLFDNEVHALFQDKEGDIWVAGRGGVCRYEWRNNLEGGSSKLVFTKTVILPDLIADAICQDDSGRVWIGTNNGIWLSGKTILDFVIPGNGLAAGISVTAICKDTAGQMWFGTNQGLLVYDPAKTPGIQPRGFKSYSKKQGLVGNAVLCVICDHRGRIWAGTHDGVTEFDGNVFSSISTTEGLSNNMVNSIQEDLSGHLWFCTEGAGISRYDGKFVRSYHGLLSELVYGISEDRFGRLWFGTKGGGLSCYDGKKSYNYSTAQGLPSMNVWGVLEDKNTGHMWIGTDKGLADFDAASKTGKPFTVYSPQAGFIPEQVFCMLQDSKGNVWFGGIGGVSCYEPQVIKPGATARFNNYTMARGLANDVVNCLAEDKNGNIWMATNNGISRLNRRKGRNQQFMTLTTKNGLVSNTVLSILADTAGNLWFGTDNGISVMAPVDQDLLSVGHPPPNLFKTLTPEGGLPDGIIYDMIEDNDGKVWIGTNLGLVCFGKNKEEKKNSRPRSTFERSLGLAPFEVYNFLNGYPIRDANSNAMYCDSRGVIWVGTGDKLIGVDQRAFEEETSQPVVLIQSIRINEQKVCWYDLLPGAFPEKEKQGKVRVLNGEQEKNDSIVRTQQEIMYYNKRLTAALWDSLIRPFAHIRFGRIPPFYPLPDNLVLPYENNTIGFEFVAVAPNRPHQTSYQYKLEGLTKNWSPVSQQASANFGNIPEGYYTFCVKARNLNGIWTEPVKYSFRILPPWYRTWWFYGLETAFLASIIFLLLRLRVYSLRKERNILENKVGIRTAEVIAQKEIVERKQTEILASIEYAKRIQQAILPEELFLPEEVSDSFVLDMPRDVIGGDFYYRCESDNYMFYAIVDCTGHGVPGAMMSILAYDTLEYALKDKGITEPGLILNAVNAKIIEKLSSGTELGTKDGMDITLCRLHKKTGELCYAGARNDLYIFAEGELHRMRVDRISIGYFSDALYTQHSLLLQKGDVVYLFTDGYCDQQGGARGKKYLSGRFRTFLKDISGLPCEEQKRQIELEFLEWKGSHVQRDDILIVGFRY
jgi:ligand-binding sensor domain-containing protein/serine phosphatase RsbU (regulator of sigma subunit)